jgi:hypothetical protein
MCLAPGQILSVAAGDCAPVSEQVAGLIDAGMEIHCLRGLTPGGVTLNSKIGTHRILEMLSGEQLPRIC